MPDGKADAGLDTQFSHVVIAVSDMDRALAFYRDVLGWAVIDDWGGAGSPRGATLSGGGIKVVGGAGITVGPILLGAAKPVHILTPTATVRRIINMTALCVVEAQEQAKQSAARPA